MMASRFLTASGTPCGVTYSAALHDSTGTLRRPL